MSRLPLHQEIERAVRRVMVDRYPELPELYWTVSTAGSLRGLVPADVPDEAAVAVLRQWVQRLQLSPATGAVAAGTEEYVGTVDRWVRVEVWGVVDRVAWFEADRGEPAEPGGHELVAPVRSEPFDAQEADHG